MRGILGRTALSIVLLGVAFSLLGYGICSHRIDVMDLAFQKSCVLADFFPESWVLRGHAAYYEDLDSRRAGECFRKAISILPLQVDAWFDLARSEAERGNEREAREVLEVLSPLLSRVSTWKWQEFLLANDMHDEERFASCMNFIFNRLPHRLEEASYLSRQFYGDWSSVLPHLEKESYPVFLRQLMRANEVDVALSLWQTMEADSHAVDSKLKLQFWSISTGTQKACHGEDGLEKLRRTGQHGNTRRGIPGRASQYRFRMASERLSRGDHGTIHGSPLFGKLLFAPAVSRHSKHSLSSLVANCSC